MTKALKKVKAALSSRHVLSVKPYPTTSHRVSSYFRLRDFLL